MKRAFAAIASFVCPRSSCGYEAKVRKKILQLDEAEPSPISDSISHPQHRKKRKIDADKESQIEINQQFTPNLLLSGRQEYTCSSVIKLESKKANPDDEESASTFSKSEHRDTTALHVRQSQSRLLTMIPPDVLSHCFLFLPISSRMSLLCVCRQFLEVCNSRHFLRNLELGGEPLSGRGGFILDEDTRETALRRLSSLVKAGNLQACYMVGIIKAYCYDDVSTGVRFLRAASNNGYIRSAYALGLILRDTYKEESIALLVRAASKGFLPALQELLPANEMKEQYGEPSAEELGIYFDSVGLGRLLRRNYSQYPRNQNASHCWNPHCGRWAYKSEKNGGSRLFQNDISSRQIEQNPENVLTTPTDDLVIASSRTPNIQNMESPSAYNSSEEYTFLTQHLQAQNQESRSHDVNLRQTSSPLTLRVSRMKMCSSCRRAKYCSKLCQVYDWRSGRHKKECRRI